MSKRRLAFCMVAGAVLLAICYGDSFAGIASHVEDFTSRQYCDTLNTTACWDTVAGELKLPP